MLNRRSKPTVDRYRGEKSKAVLITTSSSEQRGSKSAGHRSGALKRQPRKRALALPYIGCWRCDFKRLKRNLSVTRDMSGFGSTRSVRFVPEGSHAAGGQNG